MNPDKSTPGCLVQRHRTGASPSRSAGFACYTAISRSATAWYRGPLSSGGVVLENHRQTVRELHLRSRKARGGRPRRRGGGSREGGLLFCLTNGLFSCDMKRTVGGIH